MRKSLITARRSQGLSAGVAVVTNVNVDDLERCMNTSVDIAPAFEEQARLWLDTDNGKTLEPGVRERLVSLIEQRARARAFVDRWRPRFFDPGSSRVHDVF